MRLSRHSSVTVGCVAAAAPFARPDADAVGGGKVQVQPEMVLLSASLPEPWFETWWWNVKVLVRPSSTGLDLHRVAVGPYRVPGDWILRLAEKSVNVLFSTNLGTVAAAR
ncbi:MAG: hypothetical protein HC923_06680 [Myxococcales bacterium]|nr:hypothetical protein [Myxococcales bacterium]